MLSTGPYPSSLKLLDSGQIPAANTLFRWIGDTQEVVRQNKTCFRAKPLRPINFLRSVRIGYRTGVNDPNDYIFSVSASMEQLTGHLVAQTKAKEVPASSGCRRVAFASFNTNDFWKLWRVNKATKAWWFYCDELIILE